MGNTKINAAGLSEPAGYSHVAVALATGSATWDDHLIEVDVIGTV